MATVVRHVIASVEDVFDVLLDPRTYPDWLVGAQAIRSVDDDWPAVGSKFYHRVGLAGPVTIPDHSKILAIEPPHLFVLEVRVRPFGRGRSEFRLAPDTDADGRALTRIELDEVPIGSLTPLTPVFEPLIRARNIASLNGLVAFLNSPDRKSAKEAQADSESDAPPA
ncbi:MAG: SRPBCC family protein [Acidimicrobiales bacterium]